MAQHSGRHFLQIPGPTNVPDRVLRAMDMPTIDHRGPEFAVLGKAVLAGLRTVFGTAGTVVIYPASGTGAWEAAIVNTLSPGDRVLMFETGQFAALWTKMADNLGLDIIQRSNARINCIASQKFLNPCAHEPLAKNQYFTHFLKYVIDTAHTASELPRQAS